MFRATVFWSVGACLFTRFFQFAFSSARVRSLVAMVAKLPACKVCSKADSGRYSCPVDYIP